MPRPITGTSNEFERKSHVQPYTIWVICFMTMGSASYGYAAAIIATTLTQPSFNKYMKLDTATNADSLIGAMVGLYYAGGVVGSFCHGWMCNAYGRKMSIVTGMLFVLISGAFLTGSVNVAMFIVFRFFSGWG
jgi:MFS family permease